MAALPLSPPEHETSAVVDQAIDWFDENYVTCERPFIPALRRRFPLTATEACQVLREVNLRRARAS